MEQATRICKAYGLAFVGRLKYINACALEMFKQEDKADRALLDAYKTSLKAMNMLNEWNKNRRVFDVETSFMIGFYMAQLETLIELLEQ